jgi:ABC-type nitrate/sulfonate/bicarbonate transport system substrate-binding protein
MPRSKHQSHDPLRVGFVSLVDCAPLVMAQELGLFAKHGLAVELSHEVGWATIRDKVLYGELDAAQAPAGLVFAATYGLGSLAAPCLTALVINLHGNAITLSNRLRQHGVRDGRTLRAALRGGLEPITLGVVHPFSSHHVLLRQWLARHEILPGRDVQIVVVPPAQVFGNLKAEHLDGYCVGEPWNSLAVQARVGWCVATSPELAPQHPEKVLMVREDFARKRSAEHLALVAALLEACRFCDRPENRERVAEMLSDSRFVGAPLPALRASLGGTFDYGDRRIEKLGDFHVFARHNANEPSADKAAWVFNGLRSSVLDDPSLLPPEAIARCFRPDLFHQAAQLLDS